LFTVSNPAGTTTPNCHITNTVTLPNSAASPATATATPGANIQIIEACAAFPRIPVPPPPPNTLVVQPNLSIKKSGGVLCGYNSPSGTNDGTADGWVCGFSIQITNSGSGDYNGRIEIGDTVLDTPAKGNVVFEGAGGCPGTPIGFDCPMTQTSIPAGQTITIPYTIIVRKDYAAGGHCTIQNLASFSAPDLTGAANSGMDGGSAQLPPLQVVTQPGTPANIPADQVATAPQRKTLCGNAQLQLSKQADGQCTRSDPTNSNAGYDCKFTITVTNQGPDLYVGDINLTEQDGVSLAPPWQSATGAQAALGNWTFPAADLPFGLFPNQSITTTASMHVPSGSDSCTVSNTASLFEQGGVTGSAQLPPPPPGLQDPSKPPCDPFIPIEKKLLACDSDGFCRYTVKITNTAPEGQQYVIGFDDQTTSGPGGSAKLPVTQVIKDGLDWNCSPPAGADFICEIANVPAGQSREVEIVVKAGDLARAGGRGIQNCANLRINGRSVRGRSACVGQAGSSPTPQQSSYVVPSIRCAPHYRYDPANNICVQQTTVSLVPPPGGYGSGGTAGAVTPGGSSYGRPTTVSLPGGSAAGGTSGTYPQGGSSSFASTSNTPVCGEIGTVANHCPPLWCYNRATGICRPPGGGSASGGTAGASQPTTPGGPPPGYGSGTYPPGGSASGGTAGTYPQPSTSGHGGTPVSSAGPPHIPNTPAPGGSASGGTAGTYPQPPTSGPPASSWCTPPLEWDPVMRHCRPINNAGSPGGGSASGGTAGAHGSQQTASNPPPSCPSGWSGAWPHCIAPTVKLPTSGGGASGTTSLANTPGTKGSNVVTGPTPHPPPIPSTPHTPPPAVTAVAPKPPTLTSLQHSTPGIVGGLNRPSILKSILSGGFTKGASAPTPSQLPR
jgi:hypothetical protein